MKYIMKFKIPTDAGNNVVKDPQFGKKMQDLIAEVKAEAVYFTNSGIIRTILLLAKGRS